LQQKADKEVIQVECEYKVMVTVKHKLVDGQHWSPLNRNKEYIRMAVDFGLNQLEDLSGGWTHTQAKVTGGRVKKNNGGVR
jgi:hypothetical protein